MTVAEGDPYRFVKLPPRKADLYLDGLKREIGDYLRKDEQLVVVLSGIWTSLARCRSALVAVTTRRLLMFEAGSKPKPRRAFARNELAMRDPSSKGVWLKPDNEEAFRLRAQEWEENRLLCTVIEKFVWGTGSGPGPDLGSETRSIVASCQFLGGHTVAIPINTDCTLSFGKVDLRITNSHNVELARLPIGEIDVIDFSGPGAYTTGGGFLGGGFGAKGAVEGMVAASVLNSLTTKRQVQTIIRLGSPTWAGFWSHNIETPEELRIRLSWLVDNVNRRPPIPESGGGADLPDQLSRLHELLKEGVLSEEEFTAAKARIIGSP